MGTRTVFLIFVLVVAPIGAAVIVSALLLFGVAPGIVFSPGWAVLSLLRKSGVHAPNAVGVLTTVGSWWLLIVAAGAVWERSRRRRPV